MNYFAQGIQQGAEIGARSYLEKKKRDQEAVLNKARLDFEANQLRAQFAGQDTLQQKRLDADAAQAVAGRTFQSGEREKDRTYGTTEREATQGFTTGRDATAHSNQRYLQSEQLNAQSRAAFTKSLADSDAKMRREMAERAKEFEDKRRWEANQAAKTDPNNPETILTNLNIEQAKVALDPMYKPEPFGKTPGTAPVSTALPGTYKIGQKIVQDEVIYTWNGKEFVPAP
jgi:hypothetical protein